MHRNRVGRRRVDCDVEDVLLAVLELNLARRLLRQPLLVLLGLGDQVEIAGRHLAAEQVAIHASAMRKSKLIRVLPVAFGIPEPWMCSWLNRQQLPGPALIWWACL